MMEISKDDAEAIIEESPNDGFEMVHASAWTDDDNTGKYQSQELVFKHKDKLYSLIVSRSGSYFSDYYYSSEDWDDKVEVCEVVSTTKQTTVYVPISKAETENKGSISDGYHTFDELYEHRNLLFINLCHFAANPRVLGCCWWNNNGDCKGYFCLYYQTIEGQISYHIPNKYLPLVKVWCKFDDVKEWDNHTSGDVLARLKFELPEEITYPVKTAWVGGKTGKWGKADD